MLARVVAHAGRRTSVARQASHVARFEQAGNPARVVSIVEEDVAEPAADEIKVRFLASPVSVADIASIETAKHGTGVCGHEGVAVVTSVGSAVTGVKAEDWVVPRRAGVGTWRSEAVLKAADVVALPPHLHAEEAANVAPVCIADRLLTDFVTLSKGDYVVNTAPLSPVGRAVVQIARELGFRTINLLDKAESAEGASLLHKYGADIIAPHDLWNAGTFRDNIAVDAAPKLAIDGAGGKASAVAARSLAKGGVLVAYDGQTREGVHVPTSTLVDNAVTVRGFDYDAWLAAASDDEVRDLVTASAHRLVDKKVHTMVALYTPAELAEAVAVARKQAGERRPVLKF